MTKTNIQPAEKATALESAQPEGARNTSPETKGLGVADGPSADGLAFFESEQELLRELLHAIRTIQYGSIILTMHNGELVEISKTIKIRKTRQGQRLAED